MSDERDPVHQAIDRWATKGLLDEALADALRDEVDETSGAGSARASQYVLAATGAAVLVIAGGVFVQWAWPLLTSTARAAMLVVGGVALYLWGSRAVGRFRWRPAGYLMQMAGLALFLVAQAAAGGDWSTPRTVPAMVLTTAGLIFALAAAARGFGRDPVMPAAHVAFGLAYLGFFLDRTLGFGKEAVVWTLDGVVAVLVLLLLPAVRREIREPGGGWALNAFLVAMHAAFVLVAWTTFDILSWDDGAVVALDVWLAAMVALTVWGIQVLSPGLRRLRFERQLAYLALVWIVLGFWTAFEVLNAGQFGSLVLVGGAGVAGFLYADRLGSVALMRTAAFSFILALWVWAWDLAGALGGVAALVVTGGLLFWLSGRRGRED